MIAELLILIGLAFLSSLLFVIVLLFSGIANLLAWLLLLPFWVLILVVAIAATVPPLRQILITRPLWRLGRKISPKMSDTERQALEAGAVWWDGELFSGRPDWQKLQQMTFSGLTDEEQAFLDNQVTDLCQRLDDWQIIYEQIDLPEDIWALLKKERFFGMAIDKAHGGLGFSALMQSTVVSMVSTRSLSAAVDIMVPNSLGPGELIARYGTTAQQEYYLPRLANGEEIPCFALTSLAGGSDAGNMEDYGVICKGEYQGEEVIGMKVTWDKRYITLAPIATLIGLAVKLYDPEHLLGDQSSLGITLCMVPGDYPGVNIGERHFPVFQAFLNGPTSGNEVFMPLDFIIGGKERIGHGWAMLMECLSVGRGLSLPALNVGASKLSYRMSGAYAKLRQQFNCSIGQFEGVASVMGEIAGFNYLMESARVMTAGGIDLGANPALCSAIVKYHCTELGRTVLNHAMDIHAGRAIQAGPRNYILNGFIAAPLGITVEGANILTRNLIIFEQGAIRCHPFVYQEMEAMADKDQKRGLKRFDRLLTQHLCFFAGNVARGFLFGLGFTHILCRGVQRGSTNAHFYYKLTRLSTALALVTDISLGLLGSRLKRMENLSARLGDLLSYLYLASTAIKYYQDSRERDDSDLLHLRWSVEYCIYQAQEALIGFFANFPRRWTANIMRFIVFPFGRRYHPPADQLTRQLATEMMEPSSFRERITRGCYIGDSVDDPTGCVELAFRKMVSLAPELQALHRAEKAGQFPPECRHEEKLTLAQKHGILNEAQCRELADFFAMQAQALAVDVFSPGYFQPRGE